MPFARLHAEHRTPCFASNQNSPLTPLLIYVSHSSSKSPSFAMLIQGGVLCSPLVVYVWCYTPPTANAYTTRSCYARLPARFGHIILSCGVQFKGNRGRGIFDGTISLRSVRNNMRVHQGIDVVSSCFFGSCLCSSMKRSNSSACRRNSSSLISGNSSK